MRFLVPIGVLVTALVLGGFVTPLFAFLFGAAVLGSLKLHGVARRRDFPARVRHRAF
jgi:hypothetical protein